MHYDYVTSNVCSRMIHFEINDNIVTNVSFDGGCNGNLKAVSKLVNGMSADQIASILSGNLCQTRPTSCADQLARAVMQASAAEKQAKGQNV